MRCGCYNMAMWKWIILGVLAGILILHPIVMVVNHFMFEPIWAHGHSYLDILFEEMRMSLSLNMINWTIGFGIFGAVSGFYYGKTRESFIAIQKSENKYRSLINNIPGMIYKTETGRSVNISINSEVLCGYKNSELMTMEGLSEIIYPDDRQSVLDTVSRLIERPISLIQEYRIISKGGNIKWVSDHKTSTFNSDGSFNSIDGIIYDITLNKYLEEQKDKFMLKLQNALSEVNTLQGILPICSHCKKIRDDEGYWQRVESYIGQRTATEFSHGICPDCVNEYYSDL